MRRRIYTILMIILLIPLFYMIFNLGSETGLQRYILPDPSHDIWLLSGLGVGVFALNLLLMKENDRHRRGR